MTPSKPQKEAQKHIKKLTSLTGPEKILEALAQLNKALQEQKNTPVEKMLKTLEKSLGGENCPENLDLDPSLLAALPNKKPTPTPSTYSQTKPESLWGQKHRQIQILNNGQVHIQTESALLNETLKKITQERIGDLLTNFAEVHTAILECPYGSKQLLVRDLEHTGWLALAYTQVQNEELQKTNRESSLQTTDLPPQVKALKELLIGTLIPSSKTIETAQALLKTKNLEGFAQRKASRELKNALLPLTTQDALRLSQDLAEQTLYGKVTDDKNEPSLRALFISLYFNTLKEYRDTGHPLDRVIPLPYQKERCRHLLLQYKNDGCQLIAIPPLRATPLPSLKQKKDRRVETLSKVSGKLKEIKDFLTEASEEKPWQRGLRPIAMGLLIGAITTLLAYLTIQALPNLKNKENRNPLLINTPTPTSP